MSFEEKTSSSIGAFRKQFVNNTGLIIVRTLAFLVLGLVAIRIVQIIARAAFSLPPGKTVNTKK